MNLYKKIFTKTVEIDKQTYNELLAKELILRDYLAIERTILTNEATFLAYIRTSLTVIVVGATLFHLASSNEILEYMGIFTALVGGFIFLFGLGRTVEMKIKINKFLKHKKKVETEAPSEKQDL